MSNGSIERTYYVGNGEVDCGSASTQTCVSARFATAKTSSFHTEVLREATAQINKVLDQVMSDPARNGRMLDVLITPRGLLLAWTTHVVTALDDDATVTKALGL